MASDSFGYKVTIRGDQELRNFLLDLGHAIIRGPGGGPVGRALKNASEPLARKVEAAAPVDSGVLKKSIRLARMKGRTRTSINYGLVMRAVRSAAARRRSGAKSMVPFYWYFLEYGWVAKNGKKYQYPFIRPVMYANQHEVVNAFGENLSREFLQMGL